MDIMSLSGRELDKAVAEVLFDYNVIYQHGDYDLLLNHTPDGRDITHPMAHYASPSHVSTVIRRVKELGLEWLFTHALSAFDVEDNGWTSYQTRYAGFVDAIAMTLRPDYPTLVCRAAVAAVRRHKEVEKHEGQREALERGGITLAN